MADVPKQSFQSIAATWDAPARVRAMTTCRSGGQSSGPYGATSATAATAATGYAALDQRADNGTIVAGSELKGSGLNLGLNCGDDPERVLVNRQLLRQSLPAAPHWLRQIHGIEVCEFGAPAADAATALAANADVATPTTADAAITFHPGVVLSVLTADCLPIFMCNSEGDAIGVCHAGWRGLAGGIVEASAERLQKRRSQSKGWLAHLGPAIGPAAFEVGEDVRSAFCSLHAQDETFFVPLQTPGKYLANLYELASRRLRDAGFQTITGGAYCTVRDQGLFYSHRRDRQTGRMASLIWIEK